MDQDTDLVVVFRSQGHLQAEVARSKLSAAGIPAMLKYASTSTVLALTVDGLGEVLVLVPASLAEEAGLLLDAGLDSPSTEGENHGE